MSTSATAGLILILFAILLIIFGPLATIWALNTLFPALAIPYSFETWVAVLLVGGLFRQTVKIDK
jgi:hypothetical protein